MLSKQVFRSQLEKELEKKPTINHPIFKQLVTQQNWDLLRLMALQGYQLTLNFIDYIEKLYYYCPQEVHKKRILYNLFEEMTGFFSKTKNHVELMQDFLKCIDLSKEQINQTQPLPAT